MTTSPTVAQAKSFLRFVTTASHLPVFVHCRAGRNRTGVAVAIYEMAVRGMTSDAAITEGEGFGLHVAVEEQFVRDFGDLLAAHSVPGFPLVH
ncbi:MAG: tyrosine-protein phosphatase [Polyangiaceae bacterium]